MLIRHKVSGDKAHPLSELCGPGAEMLSVVPREGAGGASPDQSVSNFWEQAPAGISQKP